MEEVKKILSQFGIEDVDPRLEPLNQGLINQTCAVSSDGDKRYVLQRINQEVFPDTRSLEMNLELVLPILSREDYVRLKFYRTDSGELFFRNKKKEVWRLMSYLPQSKAYHHTSDRKVAFEAGRILGVFHRLVASLDPNELAIPIERFHDLNWRIEQYRDALQQAPQEALVRTQNIRDFISDTIQWLKPFQSQSFPVRVCHNDCKLNNILFSEDVRALCLIDLDTLMPGFFAYDFGDAVRTVANPAAEEETDLEKIRFSVDMFRSFAEGLALNKDILSAEEVSGLPGSVVYMPFLHGLRAFTDYLLGNRYYKVSYPDENLDRAKSLFRFSTAARENQPEIRAVLQELLM
jgi:Ser/Thr protein kinase RdoA (MazF antagonist)